MVEQLLHTEKVSGSSPDFTTKSYSPCSEMVSLDVWDVEAQVRFLPWRPVILLGYRLVWPKAAVFEIVIVGSNPITPAR